jgi:hypothetical protein
MNKITRGVAHAPMGLWPTPITERLRQIKAHYVLAP